jgi:hypothetical protein
MERKHIGIDVPWPTTRLSRHILALVGRAWLPSRGNILFTLLVVAGLLWASSAGTLPPPNPQSTIAYQGRLADAGGNPLTGTYSMIFSSARFDPKLRPPALTGPIRAPYQCSLRLTVSQRTV